MQQCGLCLKEKPRCEFDPEEYHVGGCCRVCKCGRSIYSVSLTTIGVAATAALLGYLIKVAL